ncbi:MAG: hypothetical protein ACO1O1_07225 [Adhaeribacter sp.]
MNKMMVLGLASQDSSALEALEQRRLTMFQKQGGTADQPEKRWQEFEELLAKPYTASMLQQ